MNDIERLTEIDAADTANDFLRIGNHPAFDLHPDSNPISHLCGVEASCTCCM